MNLGINRNLAYLESSEVSPETGLIFRLRLGQPSSLHIKHLSSWITAAENLNGFEELIRIPFVTK